MEMQQVLLKALIIEMPIILSILFTVETHILPFNAVLLFLLSYISLLFFD